MGSGRERLHNAIRGALVECIQQHGPVTCENANSAAKRIAGQLTSIGLEPLLDKAAENRLHKRYEQLKHGHERLQAHAARLRDENMELWAVREGLLAILDSASCDTSAGVGYPTGGLPVGGRGDTATSGEPTASPGAIATAAAQRARETDSQ